MPDHWPAADQDRILLAQPCEEPAQEKGVTRVGDSGSRGNMPAPGPLGRNLIANMEHLRQARGLSLNRLSAALKAIGRPIPPLGLSRIVRGERRVDVDEFVALAEVLGVSPDALLSAPGAVKQDPAEEIAAVREARNLIERVEQLVSACGDPGESEALSGYLSRALRRVQIEVEELLEETAVKVRA